MNPLRSRLSFAGLGLMLAVLVLVLSVGATLASIDAVNINGTAMLPNGSVPVPDNTWAWLLNPDKSIHGVSQVVTQTGAFSFAGIAPGAYFVRVVPPAQRLDLAPSNIRPLVIVTPTGTINLPPLAMTVPTVTGTVYAPGGITPTNAMVKVFAGPVLVEDRPTFNGDFVIGGLPTATYTLRAEPLPDDPFWPSRPMTISIEPSAPKYVTLTLQPAQISGVVREGANPIEGARVYALTPSVVGLRRSDVTGPLGRFAIGDLPLGLQVVLMVEPPIDRGGLLPPAPMTVTTPINNVVLQLGTSPKIVAGTVKTNAGISVTHALIEAHRMDALGRDRTETDANGQYLLHLSPGVWSIDVKPISTTVPHNWLDPNPPRLVQFDNTTRPEAKTINFKVITADATVIGGVELPDHSTPPFTVTVALHNDEGLGRAQDIDVNGQFAFAVPHGVYNLEVRVHDPRFAAPPLRPVPARPLTTTLVPTITLIPRNAFITGTLTNGANVPVIAWSPDTHATFGTRANDEGAYAIGVYSGTWLVRPAPLPDQPYIFNGEPATVTLAFNQIVPAVNFTLIDADAALHGVLIDADSTPVTARGWASAVNADRSVRNGAPIDAGEFNILVPAGTYTVAIDLPNGQRFMWDGQPQNAAVAAGETTTVTFSLIEKTALLKGGAWDKRADKSVDVDGRVWASDDGLHTATDLKAGGTFTLPVPAGLWRLNYNIDPEANYLKAAGPRSYGMQAGQTQIVPLPVLKKDALLTGTVVLTDGVTPARGAIVIAEGISPEVNGLTLRAPVNDDGHFVMQLPFGLYNVRSARIPDLGLINPAVKGVAVPRNGSASVTLHYRAPNAVITGMVTLGSAAPISGPVTLHAFSGDDGYNTTIAPLNSRYTLPVIAGQPWKVVATFETLNHYWVTRTLVAVPTTGMYHQDLMLAGPKLKPAPVTVLLKPDEDRRIELSDGTRIFVPAGAIPSDGRAILHITPLANAPHQRNGDVLGLSYAFEAYAEDGTPLTDSFNEDVIITFPYDPAELIARGVNIDHIKPAYFSTTTNSWTAPDSYVVDETRHEITLQINHFTEYALISTENAGYQVFVPVVMR